MVISRLARVISPLISTYKSHNSPVPHSGVTGAADGSCAAVVALARCAVTRCGGVAAAACWRSGKGVASVDME